MTRATLANELLYAAIHLTGCLVGEGERQYLPWLIAVFQQICHLVCQHTSLARPRTCNHQQWGIGQGYRFDLTCVQFFF